MKRQISNVFLLLRQLIQSGPTQVRMLAEGRDEGDLEGALSQRGSKNKGEAEGEPCLSPFSATM
eukprot:11457528-Prorocentrum_lima.AAC.1